MPKIQYKEIAFKQKSLDLIELVNSVIDEYRAQGYELTLRQAYYQLVARGYIENNERSYKNIGSLITNEVTALRDDAIYQAICDREEAEKRELQTVADEYQKVISFLSVEGDL